MKCLLLASVPISGLFFSSCAGDINSASNNEPVQATSQPLTLPSPQTLALQPDTSAQGQNVYDSVKKELSTKWTYSEEENKMNPEKIQYAEIEANDRLRFSFPYEGGSVATFVVRKKEGRTDVLLEISKGQFITSVDGGSVRLRFDSEKPIRIGTVEPSDYSHTTVFLESVSMILNKLKKAKKMYIESDFYEEGLRIMEFDVSGFAWLLKKK